LCVAVNDLLRAPVRAQSEPKHIRNIVLVHGEWPDGSRWRGVYDILVKDRYNVSIVSKSHKVEVAGANHVVYISHPKEVASFIDEAATHAK